MDLHDELADMQRDLAQVSLLAFCMLVDPSFTAPPHIQLLADYLEQVESQKIMRLMIETPPRHGKSQLSSILFPAWYLLRNPHDRVVIASHSTSLARRASRESRNIFAEHAPSLVDLSVADDSSAADRWDIQRHKGGLKAVGVGAGLAGFGSDVLVIDDAVKDMEAAYSIVQRDALWDWYTSVARTRLHPQGRIVFINTRWHLDDLAGRVLKSGEDFVRVRLPAICEDDDDLLGRKIGEALWPERYPVKELLKIKRMSTVTWNALYQQRPVDIENGVFKKQWLRFWTEQPTSGTWFQSWDMSFKETTTGSYVVGQVWCRQGAQYYLIDQVRKRCGFAESLSLIEQLTKKYPQCTAKIVEDKANGPAVIDALKTRISGMLPRPPKGSKEARAMAVQPLWEAGNVSLPDPSCHPWVEDFIDELLSFPAAPTDDQVDSMTQALTYGHSMPALLDLSPEVMRTGVRASSPWLM